MACSTSTSPSLAFILLPMLLLQLPSVLSRASASNPTFSYIIFTDLGATARPPQFSTDRDWYSSLLQKVSTVTPYFKPKIIYVYENFSGFAATLTPQQAMELSYVPAVLKVLKDRVSHIDNP